MSEDIMAALIDSFRKARDNRVPCYRCTYVDKDEVQHTEVGNEDCYECLGTGSVYVEGGVS